MGNGLSPREAEILALVAKGLTNDEIAVRLAISRRTVETHLRAVFHKTGVTRRGQLMALAQKEHLGIEPTVARSAGTTDGGVASDRPQELDPPPSMDRSVVQRRLQRYAAAVDRLVDRQLPLFEERVEITVTVGEREGLDGVIERRWTTPKPYLVYRILSPIVAWTGSPPDPDDLALICDVHGMDIQPDINSMQDADGNPLIMVLFQPGLQTTTEWTLRYGSPKLWNPLRESGQDTLTWVTTLGQRHPPTINELTLNVVFPANWRDERLIEENNLGEVSAVRLPNGRNQLVWNARTPVAATYHWRLQGRHGRTGQAPTVSAK